MEDVKTEVVDEIKPKRRRRRTKAEIEADKARKEAIKAVDTHKDNTVTSSHVVETKEDVTEDVPVENVSTVVDNSLNIVSTINVESAPVAPTQEVQVEQTLKEMQASTVVDVVGTSFIGNAKVYEAPVDGVYCRNLYSAFECLCELNGFVQVQYMKPGFGLVKGYVKHDDVVSRLS